MGKKRSDKNERITCHVNQKKLDFLILHVSLMLIANPSALIRVLVYSPLLSLIVTSGAREYTIIILVNYIFKQKYFSLKKHL